MRTIFRSAWVVVKKWNELNEEDIIFFDYDDAVFYCEKKNEEEYNQSSTKESYSRVFFVKTLYESMCYIVESAEKNGYDDGYEQGYDIGKDNGYNEGYDEGRRESN